MRRMGRGGEGERKGEDPSNPPGFAKLRAKIHQSVSIVYPIKVMNCVIIPTS